jgi:hypothetical protein
MDINIVSISGSPPKERRINKVLRIDTRHLGGTKKPLLFVAAFALLFS